MKIAFLTPEFVTEYSVGGGLGNYLARMCRCLAGQGHEVHVFVSADRKHETFAWEPGITVHRVPVWSSGKAAVMAGRLWSILRLSGYAELIARARALAAALRQSELDSPFDLVQSADYLAVGFFVKTRRPGTHVIRCSSVAELWNAANGVAPARSEHFRAWAETVAMRRADIVYAPSAFVADYLQKHQGLVVRVVRPPTPGREELQAIVPEYLPSRFLLHFGQLKGKNGTDWLCRSLALAFERVPDLRVVLVGVGNGRHVARLLEPLGEHRHKVMALYPVPKRVMYGILSRAEAVIVPSRVDNLPNTLIESLVFGKPIIGTRGASIDELVVHGENGLLVTKESDDDLAEAILSLWNQTTTLSRLGLMPDDQREMQEDQAATNFIALARG